MLAEILEVFDEPVVMAATVFVGSVLVAFIIEIAAARVFLTLAQRTRTTLDDLIVAVLRRPLFYSTIFVGVSRALRILEVKPETREVVNSSLETAAIVLWMVACTKISTAVLGAMARNARPHSILQPASLPIFDIIMRVLLVGLSIYLVMLAWGLDVTTWIASAGVVGIAVGFAAKDSLANLFAGIFIIADAPYRIGDFITFEDGLRGRVTDIGFRSTRILTRDDIEINIPNHIIGNQKIVNETGGPYTKARVAVPVSVAYGSDIDRVYETLRRCAPGCPHVVSHPEPTVYFLEFGASGLEFSLMVWVDDPGLKEIVIDELNARIYRALGAANIEIPYSKHDVYIKQFPGKQAQSAEPEPEPQALPQPRKRPPGKLIHSPTRVSPDKS